VVYTKIHHVIGPNGIYALDFNHDGTIDLLIERVAGSTGWQARAATDPSLKIVELAPSRSSAGHIGGKAVSYFPATKRLQSAGFRPAAACEIR